MHRYFIYPILVITLLISTPHPCVATDASEQLDFANGLFAKKMYKMAIAEYEKFISSYPDQAAIPRATFMIGESFLYLKDYQAAVAAYSNYLTRYSEGADAAYAHLRIAASLVELKEYVRALSEVSSFLPDSIQPDIRGEALYIAGLAEVDSANKESGMRHLKGSYDIGAASSHSSLAAYQLGRIYRDSGDLGASVKYFDAAALAADRELALLASLGGAEARLEKGDYKEAAALFRTLISGDTIPADIRDKAVIGLIRSLNSMKEFGEAAGAYEKMRPDFKSVSMRLTAALLAAQAYTYKGDHNEALATLDQYLNDKSLNEEELESVLFAKIGALMAAKRLDEARALLASKTAYKDAARSIFMRAEINYYSGSYEQAQKDYSELLNTYSGSPLLAEALYGRAFAALENKEKKAARDSFLELASRFSGHKNAPESLYSAVILDNELGLKEDGIVHAKMYLDSYRDNNPAKEILLLLGRFYTDTKNPDEAIKAYRDFEKRYPGDSKIKEAYFLLGYNFQRKGDTKVSTDYYLKITKVESGDESFYYSARKNIAQNYTAEGEDLAAAKILDDIVSNWPNNDLPFDSYLWVAKKYIESRLFDDAIRIIGLVESGKFGAANKAACAYFRSEVAQGLGRYDEAIAGYEKCIQEEAGKGAYTGAAFQGIGMCRIAMNDNDRAWQAFEDAIAFNPADNTVAMRSRFYMGDIYIKKGKSADAAKMFMMVAILYDDNAFVPEALYKAVLAFDALGKKEETVKACEDFLERFPKHSKAKEVRKVLNKREHAN